MARPRNEVLKNAPRRQAEDPGLAGEEAARCIVEQDRETKQVNNIQTKFASAMQAMQAALVERDREIEIVLTALIANEHVLLVGSPGRGKSLLLDGVADFLGIPSGEKFNYLLTKFTDPSEIFGPIDVPALKIGEAKRVYQGYLPTAQLAFLDEIFKSSSAILNTMLKVLNERTFKYGLQEFKTPLRQVMCASNEYPDEREELGALWDRLLFRHFVEGVSTDGRRQLFKKALANDDCKPVFTSRLTGAELDQAHKAAKAIAWTDDAKRAMWTISEELEKAKILPSERRLMKSFTAVRSFAYLHGATQVEPEHLDILECVLWETPGDQQQKASQIIGKIANPLRGQLAGLWNQARSVVQQLENDPAGRVEKLSNIENELRTKKDVQLKVKVAEYIKDEIRRANREVAGVK
jgi:MoxR-like ATPase